MTTIVYLGTAFQRFLEGDFFGGIMAPVIAVFGYWTYAIFFGTLLGMLYFRTESSVMPTVVFIVLLPIVLFFVPTEAWALFGIFFVLAVAGTIAKAYLPRG